MEFFRQEYWRGLPFPSPGDLPHSGTEPRSPELQARFFTIWATREAQWTGSVQSLSCVWLSVTPWIAAGQASLSNTNSQNLLKLKSIESVMPSIHLILYCPLLLLPSIFPSIRVFSNESVLHHQVARVSEFQLKQSISPSNAYSGLISFMTAWLDLLAVQGILKSFLQHHNSKASILWHSAFFTDG